MIYHELEHQAKNTAVLKYLVLESCNINLWPEMTEQEMELLCSMRNSLHGGVSDWSVLQP